MNSNRVSVNGVTCRIQEVGGGMYCAIPEDFGSAIKALTTGKINFSQLLTGQGLEVKWLESVSTPAPTPKLDKATIVKYLSLALAALKGNKTPATPTKAPKKETVAQYRARKGMSQKDLADKLGVARSTISRWEQQGRYMD